MKLKSWSYIGLAICGVAVVSSPALAAVSAAEAEKLKTELTPLGSEKAGNADGSIPAWTGGMHNDEALKDIVYFKDPFAGEKPLFSITAANAGKYADKLTDGAIALFKKYPDSYRIDVYQTHRTLANPQSVYDNTFKNATTATLVDLVPKGAWGGIPFPIPKDGAEVMWNNNLRYQFPSSTHDGRGYLVTSTGQQVLLTNSDVSYAFPYYDEKEGLGRADSHWQFLRFDQKNPPIRAGESVLTHFGLDGNDDESWVYLTGQRRVRKLPNACCDTPHPATAGVMGFDDIYVFSGRLDRFDWKILGKKEMYVPYNSNMSVAGNVDNDKIFMGKTHVNPDHVRYELHRVWVIEATLRAGYRHLSPKAKFYVDEDSWIALLGDRWAANGELWKTAYNTPVVLPELPSTFTMNFGFVDLSSGTQYYAAMYGNTGATKIHWVDKWPTGFFTSDGIAGDGVR